MTVNPSYKQFPNLNAKVNQNIDVKKDRGKNQGVFVKHYRKSGYFCVDLFLRI